MAESEVRTIRVVITLEGSSITDVSADVDGDVSADVEGGESSSAASDSNKKLKKLVKTQVRSYRRKLVNAAEQMINSYYNLEENYKAANDVANSKKFISDIMSIADAAGTGYAAGGPAVAIIMATLSVGGKIYGVGTSYVSEAERLAELSYSKRYKSEALGLIDWGRGTEN